MINVKNISKNFKENFWSKGNQVLENISFELKEGKITGFLGHNGAGKTTLIKIIMGFIRASHGSVFFDKQMGKVQKDIFRNIGYLPERPYFYPDLKGIEFLEYMSLLLGLKWNPNDKRVLKYARQLRIEHAFNTKLRGYSKGMLQRIGFLANILNKPKLIVLDEPLSGLDPMGRKEYKDIIKECSLEGASVFFSSHILYDVEEISDDILIIEKGKLIHHGSLEELYLLNQKEKYVAKVFVNGEVKTEEIEEKDLATFVAKNHQIIEISGKRSSLEEIVYKLKSS